MNLKSSVTVRVPDAAVANPTVQALTRRVDLKEEKSFTARYPAEQPVTVRIVMKNGTAHEGHCTVTKGEPARPHTPAELTGKFFELGEPPKRAHSLRTNCRRTLSSRMKPPTCQK